ncbi:hypothetical protein DU484_12405 [Haloplanus rubicundus]|uniref:Uncharacterized protein n=2 Tax=Haloplanus rubicundus TaxID=1547898 RepID=A0A345EEF9_9EURY|nr:hypothetical protein DU484_12405 [Haloplanus rubicundus]
MRGRANDRVDAHGHLDWGATDDQMDRELPGDELVPAPSGETTRTCREATYTRAVESVLRAGEYRGNVARDDAERPD